MQRIKKKGIYSQPKDVTQLYAQYRQRPLAFHFYRFRAYLCLVYFGLFFGLSYPFFRWAISKPSRYHMAHRWRVVWAKSIAMLFGIRVQTVGKVPDLCPKLMVVANHFSYLDIPVLAAALPLNLHFVAKAELSRFPFFRHFFRTMDISIPRSSAQGSKKAYQRVEEFWKAGSAVVVFPEGGILGQAPAMTAFRTFPFAVALQQGATILPVSLPDTWKILPECPRHFLRPGPCRVHLLEPQVPEAFLGDEKALKNKCYELIHHDLITHES
ncbi:MAG: 1-acyl-sn-glycerol-3-phosphate acyltransferase [Sphingomonadales bacterium]|nr:1-acyl-sn-glycerol-3-phosphate acyltransferase [Sphingomonadales bacterium]